MHIAGQGRHFGHRHLGVKRGEAVTRALLTREHPHALGMQAQKSRGEMSYVGVVHVVCFYVVYVAYVCFLCRFGCGGSLGYGMCGGGGEIGLLVCGGRGATPVSLPAP